MKTKTRPLGTIVFLTAILLLVSSAAQPTAAQMQPISFALPSSIPDPARVSTALSTAPVMFIENVGQFGTGARFQVRGGNGTVYLADDAIWFTVLERPQTSALSRQMPTPERLRAPREDTPRKGANIKLSFVGANPKARLEPFNRLDTRVSYFIGNDPKKWRADVPVWGGVRYKDLYPGIDLEITSEKGQMVQRVVARAGANLNVVQLRVDGVDKMTLDSDRLRLTTAVGEYTLPLLQVTGATNAKPPRPTIAGNQVASPFTQSPTSKSAIQNLQSNDLLYSTFLGGSSIDWGYGIAVDTSGAAYVTGYTGFSDFPTTPGAFDPSFNGSNDAFIVKLNATGSALTYATFLGGSDDDWGGGIAVDASGAAYVTGGTGSSDFPTTPGAFDTTFGGGTCGVAPNTYPCPDAFVVKLNAAGSALTYATFSGGSFIDYGRGIAIDSSGAVYVTGRTSSSDFPTTPGAFDPSFNGNYDAFVVKLNATGSALLYSTFLGGSSQDYGWSIAVDASGAAYVAGYTGSSDFPAIPGAFDPSFNGTGDAFIVKLNAAGSALTYATFLGGSDDDWGGGIAVDASGAAYVTGYTYSSDFPTTPGAFDLSYNGYSDAFIVKLNATGSALTYATFLGGGISQDYGWSIAVDASGAAYVTGTTWYSDFPTTPGAFDPSYNGTGDAFVVKLGMGGTTTYSISPVYPTSHSIASTIMQGGTAYRYFRLLDASGNPIANATVTFSRGSPALSDASGYFTATIPTSALGGPGSYQVSVQSVTYGGQTYPTNNQPTFGIQVTERRYSNAWSYGASTRAKGGVSAGLVAYLQRTTSGGLELKLDESNPDITTDDVVLMKEDFSDEIGAGGGVGIEKGVSVLILQVKGGAEATSEFALRTIGNTQTRFPNPYSDNDRKAEGVYLLASAIDSLGQASPGKPFGITFLKLAIDRNAPYSSYISQQQAGLGSKITPLRANVGASASLGLKRSGTPWKAASLGFELVDVGVNVVQMNILTDYRDRNEWGLGYESEHNVDFTLLSPSAEVGKFKSKLGWLMNNQARKVRVELLFDGNTNALKRLELAFTGDGNAGAFGGTIEEATAKISIPASQLGSNRLSRTVNILRLLQAAQQTGNSPLRIGASAMINELNNLLSGLGYAEYEYTVDDGAQKRYETELSITALIKLELGPSFEVKQVRSLVRERGVFTSGQFYTTESYSPDSFVSRAGKSWQDLTMNALGGLWLLVQDAFNWVSQQVSSGIGWVLNIVSRTATGITQGGAQLNVPSGTQLQRLSPIGARLPLTDPITVTATSWVPTSGTTSAPRRLRADLAVATGEGFVVGGIYEFRPSTMTFSPAATLVITYTNAAATGKDKSRIGMFRWNETGNNWQPLTSQTPDPTNNKVTANITQLGTYALGYDVTPPQITSITPANGTTITNTLPIISALVTDTGVGINPSSVQMRLNGQIVAATFITGTGQLVYMPPTVLPLGSHTVAISAQDVVGNPASASATFNLEADNLLYLPVILK